MSPDVYYFAIGVALLVLCLTLRVVASADRVHKDIMRDRVRFMLFAARDRLYVAAARGTIPVESRAFQEIRSALNHLIRGNKSFGFVALMSCLKMSRTDTEGDFGKAFFLYELTPEGVDEATEILVFTGEALIEAAAVNSNLSRALVASGAIAASDEPGEVESATVIQEELRGIRRARIRRGLQEPALVA